jgi:CBS domain-containing protein
MPLVSEHMTASLLTISAEATVGEAATAMVERGVGAVVVVEGEAIAAILTERDVMKAVAAGNDGTAPVADWMTRHPETIEPEDTTDHAATLMIHGGFRHLPVVLGAKVVGIVSIRDLMKVALDDRSPRGV